MVKESTRKGSHCGNNNGHNARTCNEKVVKLFGVKISKESCDDEYMQKSSSMANLNSCTDDKSGGDRGYVSDGPVQSGSDGRKRKKGTPWTEEEHKTFLDGLEKLGKGDWRGISREFVTTKTPTQVASHAQKYFIRQVTPTVRKRRSSLSDLSTKPPPQIFPAFPQGTFDRFPHQQVSPSINFATQLEAQPMPAATRSIPNFHGIPYMARNMGGRLSYVGTRFYPALSFEPMMNFPNGGYVYVPNGLNSIPTSAVAPAHSSRINPSGRKIGSPSTMETDLELSLAAPQTSNPGGSIVVI